MKILFFIVEVYDKTWRFLIVFTCVVFFIYGKPSTQCLFVWWCLTPLSVISWLSVLLVEETGGPHVTDKLYHIMLYTSPWSKFELTTSVVIGTACIDSCKSNYHTISATATPQRDEDYFSGACLRLKEYRS